MKTKREDINKGLGSAAETFRVNIDSSVYKDYILVMLFEKYLSDMHKEHLEEYRERYDGDKTRVERAMSRERFILDEKATFDYLYKNRTANNIGEIINKALIKIEEDNRAKLRNLLQDFNKLDLSPSALGDADIIGDAYQYMIEKFASDAGKKGGEFFTPPMVSELLARLVKPEENDRVYDPTCGSGSLLIRTAKKVESGKLAVRIVDERIKEVRNIKIKGIVSNKISRGESEKNID